MGVVKSFLGGLLMTLVLAVLVPIVCNEYILPDISEYVGDYTVLLISSEMLVNLIMYLIIFAFMGLLGGTMIFRRCGVFGVLGLIAAYALLGDLGAAVVPLMMLLLSLVIFKTIEIKRRKKRENCQK